ncbi:MAG: transglycosylase SLT domain-containing protein [Methylococcaceae bacterium]|nr:transglycosylase SLT domain-containing protein [Methylococcaceae bacterium]MDP2395005.1 transglycosylase SLT domain-containing protein [Methylococcaceae bacterium]MDP3020504.1 transglycosylase SLT domain-containing protein [Methylococcaceae bacterium]MDP3389867.1 transglycosylase SLT domain-containing protein [Methylococcaceae bacterium]MDP3933187.1 transglycosylase SLT domain-containing protein [Methylococcaceae bacterium]
MQRKLYYATVALVATAFTLSAQANETQTIPLQAKALPFTDLSPRLQERVVCSLSAAMKYEVPANIVLAVAEKEAGKPGQWVLNANGTHDVGAMQFNTAYLSDLARYGISANDVAAAGCYSFDLAAWRLRQHIKHDKGDLWTRAANYHSKTPHYNAIYRADLMAKAVKWADWLDARFVTYDVIKSGIPNATSAATEIKKPVVSAPSPQPVKTVAWNTSKYVPRKLIINGQP